MSESHWISSAVSVQRVERDGFCPLYVGCVDGISRTFYALGDMADWFMQQRVDMGDPIWDYIDQLADEELSGNVENE